MTTLKKLAKQAIRYGITPECIGPISTFTDEAYMKGYLGFIESWATPASYGGKAVDRERAKIGVLRVLPDFVQLHRQGNGRGAVRRCAGGGRPECNCQRSA